MFVNKQDYLDIAKLMVENKGNGFPNVLFVISPPGTGMLVTLGDAGLGEEFIDLDRMVLGAVTAETAKTLEADKLYVYRVGSEADLAAFNGAFADRAFIFEAKFNFSAAH